MTQLWWCETQSVPGFSARTTYSCQPLATSASGERHAIRRTQGLLAHGEALSAIVLLTRTEARSGCLVVVEFNTAHAGSPIASLQRHQARLFCGAVA